MKNNISNILADEFHDIANDINELERIKNINDLFANKSMLAVLSYLKVKNYTTFIKIQIMYIKYFFSQVNIDGPNIYVDIPQIQDIDKCELLYKDDLILIPVYYKIHSNITRLLTINVFNKKVEKDIINNNDTEIEIEKVNGEIDELRNQLESLSFAKEHPYYYSSDNIGLLIKCCISKRKVISEISREIENINVEINKKYCDKTNLLSKQLKQNEQLNTIKYYTNTIIDEMNSVTDFTFASEDDFRDKYQFKSF